MTCPVNVALSGDLIFDNPAPLFIPNRTRYSQLFDELPRSALAERAVFSGVSGPFRSVCGRCRDPSALVPSYDLPLTSFFSCLMAH